MYHVSISKFIRIVMYSITLVCLSLFLGECVGNAYGQTAPEPKLVIAQNAQYDTTAVASHLYKTDPVPPISLLFSNCLLSSASQVLPLGGAVRVDHVGQLQCTDKPKEFYLIDSPYAQAYTIVRYKNGLTGNTLVIPQVYAISSGDTAWIGPVENTGDFKTTVTVFPEKHLTRVFIDILDEHGQKVGFETFDADVPVAQYTLAYPLRVGSLKISTGSYVGDPDPLYGLVDVSTGIGEASVIPFPPPVGRGRPTP